MAWEVGIEPTSAGLEAAVLPLDDTHKKMVETCGHRTHLIFALQVRRPPQAAPCPIIGAHGRIRTLTPGLRRPGHSPLCYVRILNDCVTT